MKLNKAVKSVVSLLLCVSMVFVQAAPVLATDQEEKETVTVEGTRFSEEDLPEESIVYFGVTSLAVEETDTIYRIPVYRSGSVLPEESVTFHTMDISALYGKDYELIGKGRKTGSTGKTILELLTVEEEAEEKEYEVTVTGEDISSYRGADVSVREKSSGKTDVVETESNSLLTATPSDAGNYTGSFQNQEKTGKSELALLKEEQTGLPTRETGSSGLSSTLTEALAKQVIPELYSQLAWSCEQKIYFEEGQQEATVEFRVLEDTAAEGAETFSVAIVEAEKTRPYGAVSLSVVINDDEAPVYSVLSLDKENYITDNGLARVTVNRSKALSSLCTAMLKGTETATGEEITYGEVVFMPYEESREVTLNIERETRITLCELTAAVTEETSVTEAVVFPEETLGQDSENYEILSAGEDFEVEELSEARADFNITFKNSNKTYLVKVQAGKGYGIIYDTSYDNPPEVGIYVLPNDAANGGWFTYGLYGGYGKPSKRHSQYNAGENRGYLQWYSSYIGRTGYSAAKLQENHAELESIYYQYVAPDWEQTGQNDTCRVDFFTDGSGELPHGGGKFDRGVYDNGSECAPVSSKSTYMHFEVQARDTKKGSHPDVNLYLYGVACMYKCLRFTWEPAKKMSFKYKQGTVEFSPFQFKIDAGVVSAGAAYQRDFYANIDDTKTNLVVSTSGIDVAANESGIFGNITGYRFSVTKADNTRTTLEYPGDYFKWLRYRFGSEVEREDEEEDEQEWIARYYGEVQYRRRTEWVVKPAYAQLVNTLESAAKENLNQIAVNKYFLEWIQSQNIRTVNKGDGGKTYYQEIHVEPIVEYINVNVKVLPPEGTTSASQAKGSFRNLTAGTYNNGEFHAGDTLDLSCTTVDTEKYEVDGYEVSENGGAFNTIRDKNTLLLKPNVSYVIRPAIKERVNGIQVIFEGDAEDFLKLENAVVSQSELQDSRELKGNTYLNLNPKGETVADKISVTPGKVYTVNCLVTKKPEDPDYVYRPVFRDALTLEEYNGQSYSFKAQKNARDNVISIRVEKVKKADLKTYTLEGYAMTSVAAIRDDALGKHENPALGYIAQTGSGQESRQDKSTGLYINSVKIASGAVEEDGKFVLKDITAKSGDRLSLLLSSGESDSQVLSVKTQGSGGTQNIGKQELEYPCSAPCVENLSYSYEIPGNDKKTDLRNNSVLMQDDRLKLTATVNTKDRNITKAVFRSVTAKGTVREYTANANPSNPGVFELTLPKLLDNFSNGEKLQVYLVEEKEVETSEEEGKKIKVEQDYPVVETGLCFYTRSETLVPKNFNVSAVVDQFQDAVDIPLLGNAVGNLESGKLDISRTEWPGKKGYSITVGLNAAVFQSIGEATTKEKLDYYKKYKENAQKVTAGRIAEKEMKTPSMQRDSDRVNDFAEGQTAKAEMNKSATVTFNVKFRMDLEFILNPETNQYMLYESAFTFGGSGTISKTFYTVAYSIPFYINLAGSGDVSFTLGGREKNVQEAMSLGQFDEYGGDLKTEFLENKDSCYGQLDMAAEFKASAGVGVCGVLGARGFVALGLQFQWGNNPMLTENTGFVLYGKGGIGVDFLVGTFDFNIINAAKGFGSLKNQTKVTMWNNMENTYGSSAEQLIGATETEASEASDEILTEESTEESLEGELTFRELDAGADPAENFDISEEKELLGAAPVKVSEKVILENAAQYTRPQLLDLGDGRQFLSFIGASREGKSVLYYSVCSEAGIWETPRRVYESSVQDAEASLLLSGDKVYLAWQCAETDVDQNASLKTRISAFDLKLAVYNTKTGTMSAPEKLTDNKYLPINPHLSSLGDEVYCSYTLVDYASAQKLEDFTDFSLNYSTPAYTVIRDGKAVPYGKGEKKYLERLVTVEHPTLNDPLVTDFQTETLTLPDTEGEERRFFVSAYTIDEDENSATETDREVYLKVTEQNKNGNKIYAPIRLTRDALSDAYPELTRLGDGLYLSWISDTATFCLLDVRELLSAFFAPDTGSTDYDNSIKGCFSASSGENWYQKTAEELGIPEDTAVEDSEFCYERSVYPELAENKFNIAEKDLETEDEVFCGINEYQLVSDGDDLYVFFTGMQETFENTGVEIYGFRYQRGAGYSDSSEETEVCSEIGFSDPVQITDTGEAHDEISLYMTEDREISLVSSLFTQKINESTGEVELSDYKLVHTVFVSEGSVEIKEDSLELPSELIPGQMSRISLVVSNVGLYPSEGFHLEATACKDGVITEIFSTDIAEVLDTNDSLELEIPWKIPENAAGTKVTVKVRENGTAREYSSVASATVEDRKILSIFDLEASEAEFKEIQVTANVLNAGNTETKACMAYLVNHTKDEDGNLKETVLAKKELSDLKPGKTAEVIFRLEPAKENFSEMGEMELEVRIMDGEDELDSMWTSFVADKPMLLELSEGKTDIYLKKGETMQITAQAYPWNELSGEVYYAAQDCEVAAVSAKGEVLALKEGTTVVSGYCPASSIASFVNIHVGDEERLEEEETDSGISLPSWVISNGKWKKGTDGSWSYLLNGNPVKNGWFCVCNPYADAKKKQKIYAWFWFDGDGRMKTGWINDTDGNRYYLNPVSDNTQGAMVTGWRQIEGKWYYFSEKEGSGTCGALLKNTVTPDGYPVDKDGVWKQEGAEGGQGN